MKFLLDIFKKLFKILALYLIYGFVLSLIVSFTGAAENLLILQTMGTMTLADYMMLLAYMELLWLPLLTGMILSPHNYLSFPLSSWIVPIIVVSFFILIILIATKE